MQPTSDDMLTTLKIYVAVAKSERALTVADRDDSEYIFTDCKGRWCFYTCLSVHGGGVGVVFWPDPF